MDYEGVKKAAQSYIPDMTKFLRDLIAIPSESCEEEGVVKRTIEEMKKLGFDKAEKIKVFRSKIEEIILKDIDKKNLEVARRVFLQIKTNLEK